MTYLPLETCQLLEKLGCTSESGMLWDSSEEGIVELEPEHGTVWNKISSAFTWDDICTKENAIKCFSEAKDYGYDCPTCRMAYTELFSLEDYKHKMANLLKMKLNNEDWKSKLLEHLKGIK